MYPAIPLQKLVVREVARCCKKVVNDRTAKNVVRPNPNGSAISTERSAEQFGRTSAKITSNYRQKISKKLWQKIIATFFTIYNICNQN